MSLAQTASTEPIARDSSDIATPTLEELLRPLESSLPDVRESLAGRLMSLASAAVLVLIAASYGLLVIAAFWLACDYLAGHLRLLGEGQPLGNVWPYAVPAVLVMMALLLLIKPAFHWAPPGLDSMTLRREDEPLLYAYVERICRVLGAPPIERIEVTLGVNAAASLSGRIWHRSARGTVLTLGLTLIEGLSVRELTGVIAHEAGHFRRHRQMRVHGLVRAINFWFARVIGERDRFDLWLARYARPGYGPLRVPFVAASLLVTAGRWVLWVFMMLAHAASCVVSRRDELACDLATAQIAGSRCVPATLQRLAVLDMAGRATLSDLAGAWKERRLADDLPALIVAKAERLRRAEQEQFLTFVGAQKTGWLDTHPALPDRVRAADEANCPGLVTDPRPARMLLRDFRDLCRRSTTAWHRWALEGRFKPELVVPTETLVREFADLETAQRALRRFYQCDMPTARPIFPADGAATPPGDVQVALERLAKARQKMIESHRKLQVEMDRFARTDATLVLLRTDLAFLNMGVTLQRGGSAVPPQAAEEFRREITRLEAEREELENRLKELDRYARWRMGLAIQLLHAPAMRDRLAPLEPERLASTVARLLAVCRPLEQATPAIDALAVETRVLVGLLQLSAATRADGELQGRLGARTRKVLDHLAALRARLASVEYPFEHHAGRVSVGLFLVDELPEPSAREAVAMNANEAILSFETLQSRVMAGLVHVAERVENALGLEAEADPEEPNPYARWEEQLRQAAAQRRGRRAEAAYAIAAQAGGLLVALILIAAFGLGVAAAPRASSKLPHHASYQPTIVPAEWVRPSPYPAGWPNQTGYRPPGFPFPDHQQPRPGQPGYVPGQPPPGHPAYVPTGPQPGQPRQPSGYPYQPSPPRYGPPSPPQGPSAPRSPSGPSRGGPGPGFGPGR